MNKLFKTIIIFSSLTIGIQTFAMEKDEPLNKIEIPAITLANQILQNFLNDSEINKKDIDKLTLVLKRIKKDLVVLKSYDILNYNFCNAQIIEHINSSVYAEFAVANNTLEKLNMFKRYLCFWLNTTQVIMFGIFRKNFSFNYYNSLRIKTLGIFLSGIDLFDTFFTYVWKNKIDMYEQEVLSKIKHKMNFSHIVLAYLIDDNKQNLIDFLINCYDQIIEEDILNNPIESDFYANYGTSYLFELIGKLNLGFDQHNKNVRDLQHKLISEPTINIKSWINVCNIMRSNLENLKLLNLPEDAQKIYILILNMLNKVIKWKQQSMALLRNQLFDAIESQDVELTKKYAHALYTITRNFEKENGDTPLHIAILTKNEDLIKALLSIYPGLMLIANNDGKTPMHIAAGAGPEILKVIMDLMYQIKEQLNNVTSTTTNTSKF